MILSLMCLIFSGPTTSIDDLAKTLKVVGFRSTINGQVYVGTACRLAKQPPIDSNEYYSAESSHLPVSLNLCQISNSPDSVQINNGEIFLAKFKKVIDEKSLVLVQLPSKVFELNGDLVSVKLNSEKQLEFKNFSGSVPVTINGDSPVQGTHNMKENTHTLVWKRQKLPSILRIKSEKSRLTEKSKPIFVGVETIKPIHLGLPPTLYRNVPRWSAGVKIPPEIEAMLDRN